MFFPFFPDKKIKNSYREKKLIIRMNDDPDKISQICIRLKETKPHLEDILDFYEKIFLLQAKSFKTLKIKPVLISQDLLQAKLAENFPLITREFSIDFNAAEKLFGNICQLCSDHKIKAHESMTLLLNIVKNHELSFKEIAEKFLYKNDSWLNDFTEKNNIEKSSLEFLLYNALKPGIVQCSYQIASYLDKTPGKTQFQGYCPVCGSTPGISLLSSENGSRSFVCSFCWHEWETHRIFCPFCNTTDSKVLSYLQVEGEKGIRGDVCDKCMNYIKTIDLREYTHDIFLPLELLGAISLDIKLQEEGYQSGTD